MSAKKQQIRFNKGDLVFAKVRGYPHWPARISSLADDKGYRFHVFFYGTYETAVCKREDLCHFNEETKDKYWKQTRKGFLEGLYEIENTPDIAGPVDDDGIVFGDVSQNDSADSSISETPPISRPPKRGTKRKLEEDSIAEQKPQVALTAAKTPVSKTTPSKSAASKTPLTKTPAMKTPVTNTPTVNTPVTKTPAAKTPITETSASKTRVTKTPSTKTPVSMTPATTSPASKTRATRAAAIKNLDTSTPVATATVKTPSVTPAKSAKSPEKVDSPNDVEKMSRSGRIIRHKKFDDEDVSSPSITPNKSDRKKIVPDERHQGSSCGPTKVWIQVKSTGDLVEIDLNQGRPSKFESESGKIKWENSRKSSIKKLREKIESGDFVPEEIRNKKTEVVGKEKLISIRQEKVRWLKLEQRLIEVDLALRKAAHHLHPDIKKSLDLLSELHGLTVGALLVKKHPEVVETVRKLRKYVGPKNIQSSELADLKDQIEKIRLKANSIYVKIKSSFAMPDDNDVVESLSAERIDLVKALQEIEENDQISNKRRRMTK